MRDSRAARPLPPRFPRSPRLRRPARPSPPARCRAAAGAARCRTARFRSLPAARHGGMPPSPPHRLPAWRPRCPCKISACASGCPPAVHVLLHRRCAFRPSPAPRPGTRQGCRTRRGPMGPGRTASRGRPPGLGRQRGRAEPEEEQGGLAVRRGCPSGSRPGSASASPLLPGGDVDPGLHEPQLPGPRKECKPVPQLLRAPAVSPRSAANRARSAYGVQETVGADGSAAKEPAARDRAVFPSRGVDVRQHQRHIAVIPGLAAFLRSSRAAAAAKSPPSYSISPAGSSKRASSREERTTPQRGVVGALAHLQERRVECEPLLPRPQRRRGKRRRAPELRSSTSSRVSASEPAHGAPERDKSLSPHGLLSVPPRRGGTTRVALAHPRSCPLRRSAYAAIALIRSLRPCLVKEPCAESDARARKSPLSLPTWKARLRRRSWSASADGIEWTVAQKILRRGKRAGGDRGVEGRKQALQPGIGRGVRAQEEPAPRRPPRRAALHRCRRTRTCACAVSFPGAGASFERRPARRSRSGRSPPCRRSWRCPPPRRW